MAQILLAALALGCAILCVGIAGLLRRITDVKLSLGGLEGGHRPFVIDMGRQLPADVVEAIPDPADDALVVVASTSCDLCRELLGQLDRVSGQVVVGILREGSDEDVVVNGNVTRLGADVIELFAREFELTHVPVVIAQRGGYVTAAAYGPEIGDGEKLKDFQLRIAAAQAAEDRLEVVAG